jgi:hypothetical protein
MIENLIVWHFSNGPNFLGKRKWSVESLVLVQLAVHIPRPHCKVDLQQLEVELQVPHMEHTWGLESPGSKAPPSHRDSPKRRWIDSERMDKDVATAEAVAAAAAGVHMGMDMVLGQILDTRAEPLAQAVHMGKALAQDTRTPLVVARMGMDTVLVQDTSSVLLVSY